MSLLALHGRVECGADEKEVLAWRGDHLHWEVKGWGRRLLEEGLWDEMVWNTERLASGAELLQVQLYQNKVCLLTIHAKVQEYEDISGEIIISNKIHIQ